MPYTYSRQAHLLWAIGTVITDGQVVCKCGEGLRRENDRDSAGISSRNASSAIVALKGEILGSRAGERSAGDAKRCIRCVGQRRRLGRAGLELDHLAEGQTGWNDLYKADRDHDRGAGQFGCVGDRSCYEHNRGICRYRLRCGVGDGISRGAADRAAGCRRAAGSILCESPNDAAFSGVVIDYSCDLLSSTPWK